MVVNSTLAGVSNFFGLVDLGDLKSEGPSLSLNVETFFLLFCFFSSFFYSPVYMDPFFEDSDASENS